MSEEKADWNPVDVPEKVEFEIEGKEDISPPKIKIEEPQSQSEASEDNIKELDGIETQGAQKRIRQLVKKENL